MSVSIIHPSSSKAHEYVSFLHAGVERLPKHKRVQPCPQLLSEGHNNVQVSFHGQIQVRLQIAQGSKRLLPFLPVKGGREEL